ncbi:beta-galactosidase [Bacteroides caccae]
MVIVICFYNECIGVKIIKHLFNRQNFIFIVRSGPYVCAEWEMGGLYFRIRWQTCQP